MEAVKTIGLIIAAMLAVAGAAAAGDDYPWDDWAPYTQRHDKMTATSGNAQEVNSITHIITPWPPYVMDRRIPGNGARMVGAMKRYRDPRSQAGDDSGMPKVTTRSEVTVQSPADQLPGLMQSMGSNGQGGAQQ